MIARKTLGERLPQIRIQFEIRQRSNLAVSDLSESIDNLQHTYKVRNKLVFS